MFGQMDGDCNLENSLRNAKYFSFFEFEEIKESVKLDLVDKLVAS